MRQTPALIQWHEGMFLSPQHFQQLQRRFEALLSLHQNIAHSDLYGVMSLKYDTLTLSDDLLRITKLEAFMPDGLFIEYPSSEFPQTLELDLAPYKERASTAPVRVYLCVPEFVEGQSPVVGEWPRYNSLDGGSVSDENLSDNVIAIPRLQPKLSLIVADTYPARYESFPLAELTYQDGNYNFTSYMPPYLGIAIDHPFHERASSFVNRIREKAQYLCDKWQKQVGTALLSDTAARLRPLVKILPVMEGFLQGRSYHPRELYDLLCNILGEFCTMRLSQTPPLVPSYQHDNLNGCLLTLFDLIEGGIDSIEQSVVVIPFSQRDRLFYIRIQESFKQNDFFIGLRGPSAMNEDQVFEWMRDAVICCDSMVETARIKRVSGVGRQPLTQDESADLFVGRGTLLFKLDVSSEFFKVGENLNIFNASDTEMRRPMAVTLYLERKDDTA